MQWELGVRLMWRGCMIIAAFLLSGSREHNGLPSVHVGSIYSISFTTEQIDCYTNNQPVLNGQVLLLFWEELPDLTVGLKTFSVHCCFPYLKKWYPLKVPNEAASRLS